MKDWAISARLAELGHRINTRENGFRCATCARTISDILNLKLICEGRRNRV
jgi:hypothetical protein